MTEQAMNQEMVAGMIVEFFEAREIVCGVCTAVKNQRLSILTGQNREASLSQGRVIHASTHPLNLKLTRDELVQKVVETTALRKSLMTGVNVEELWSLLEDETDGFVVEELVEFVFSHSITDNHIAALQRVLFDDRIYFQFKDGRFFVRSREKVEQRLAEIAREEEREAQLEEGSLWLQAVWNKKPRRAIGELQARLIDILKSFALFGQESPEALFVKELFKRANIPTTPQSAFRLLVRLGIWRENENLYLLEHNISAQFPSEVEELAARISPAPISVDQEGRQDLRRVHTFTVDSAQTRDYDDALSLEIMEDGLYEIGIHIADAAALVEQGTPLDREAEVRASSIYLPDGKIAMLPPAISEGVCSLKAGKDRLVMSFLFRMDAQANVIEQKIVPSVVRIREQLTYQEVDDRVGKDDFLRIAYDLAVQLRKQRLEKGAVILPLPEIQVYVNSVGMIHLSRYEKETPSQIMVSEWMIAANALAGSYLAEHGIPAIYRSQAECKQETDFTQSEHPIFHIFRKRRLFARAELDTKSAMHCSLAVPHYTTVTSPIRRYADLVVQRQLKHALLTGEPLYGEEELKQLMTRLGVAQGKISLIQRKWTRYWILKYMEQEDIQTINALILEQNQRFAHLLLPDFLIEVNAPVQESNRGYQPGEMVKVKIERINPREDQVRVQLPEMGKGSV